MRSALLALAAAALVAAGPAAASPLDPAVTLEPGAPRTGEAVRGRRVVRGVATAPEGVLRVELYVVRGGVLRPVAGVASPLPAPSLGFAFTWDTAADAPGVVDLRVVATTLLRAAAAEVPGVVVAAPPPGLGGRAVPPPPAPVPAARADAPAAVAAGGVDRSLGVYLGGFAGTLPYEPPPPSAGAAGPGLPETALGPLPARSARRGAVPVAAGLLVLVCSAHVHRALRGLDGKGPR